MHACRAPRACTKTYALVSLGDAGSHSYRECARVCAALTVATASLMGHYALAADQLANELGPPPTLLESRGKKRRRRWWPLSSRAPFSDVMRILVTTRGSDEKIMVVSCCSSPRSTAPPNESSRTWKTNDPPYLLFRLARTVRPLSPVKERFLLASAKYSTRDALGGSSSETRRAFRTRQWRGKLRAWRVTIRPFPALEFALCS